MDAYKVRLDAFEGPMDLLLHLIEKNKIDIYDIPIAEITEQYIEYIDESRQFDIEISSEFLVMAATLLHIKSRMMLPKAPKTEEGEEEDPRQELVERIIEYRRFKAVSEQLEDMAKEQQRFFSRPAQSLHIRHLPPENLSLDELVEAFFTVARSKADLISIPKVLVEKAKYTVEEKLGAIIDRLYTAGGEMLFVDAFDTGTKEELIVTFLAMLELIKLKSIVVYQPYQFGEIVIKLKRGKTDANY